MREEQRKEIIDIWTVIIEVQKHFNDICMRIRSMFVTILLALFASIGFLIDKKLGLEISIFKIQFATLLPLFGCLGAYLFYFIDRYWYHRLLVGSIKHGKDIEEKYKADIPELSLTAAISAESPFPPRGPARWVANLVVNHPKYRETGLLHSDGKIEFFYKSVMLALFATTFILAVLGGVSIERETDTGSVSSASKGTIGGAIPPSLPSAAAPTPALPAPAINAAPQQPGVLPDVIPTLTAPAVPQSPSPQPSLPVTPAPQQQPANTIVP